MAVITIYSGRAEDRGRAAAAPRAAGRLTAMIMGPLPLALLLAASLPRGAFGVSVTNLRTEYLENPLGLDRLQPRFQWEIEAGGAQLRGFQILQDFRLKSGEGFGCSHFLSASTG